MIRDEISKVLSFSETKRIVSKQQQAAFTTCTMLARPSDDDLCGSARNF